MAKPVTHTVENLEAGQRDSIRRARAKAEGAKPEEYNNLPSDAEVSRARAAERAESSESEEEEKKTSGDDEGSAQTTRRGPQVSSSGQSSSEGS